MGERSREVEFKKPVVLPDVVFEVGNVRAPSMPAYSLVLGFLLTVHSYFHAVVEHAVAFRVVHQVELYTVTGFCVLDSEVKPLGVANRVDVVLHQAIVLLV